MYEHVYLVCTFGVDGSVIKQEGFNMCGFGSTDLHKKNVCEVLPRNGGTMFDVGTKTTAAKTFKKKSGKARG
jgi:hypothetical protein